MYNGHKTIDNVHLRVSQVAMLYTPDILPETPTKPFGRHRGTQAHFLAYVSKKGVPCRMADNGDIEIHGKFVDELTILDCITKDIGKYFKEKQVETIIFVDDLWRR